MGFQFQHREFIWMAGGIILLLLLFIFLLRWKKKVKKRIGDPILVNSLISSYSNKKFVLKLIFLIIAFGLGVVAVMNLRRPAADETSQRKGIDVVIALEIGRAHV